MDIGLSGDVVPGLSMISSGTADAMILGVIGRKRGNSCDPKTMEGCAVSTINATTAIQADVLRTTNILSRDQPEAIPVWSPFKKSCPVVDSSSTSPTTKNK